MTLDEIIKVMARAMFSLSYSTQPSDPDHWKHWIADATAAHAALTAKGLVILPERREFICKKCHARTDEGKPENYHPF
jgi:hypothetical protein